MSRLENIPGARRSASVILRCGLAVALVAAALGLTSLLQNIVSTAGYLFFYVAVVASAWFGGKWAGWLAVVCSALSALTFSRLRFIPLCEPTVHARIH